MHKKYIIFDLDGTLIHSTGIILDIIVEFFQTDPYNCDIDSIKEYFMNSAGTPLRVQVAYILGNEYSSSDVEKITANLYEILNKQRGVFFPGIPEVIRKISKEYKLFLSTGSSTIFASQHLGEYELEKYFTLILGSDRCLKGKEHLEAFQEIVNDKDFCKHAIYVGDGNHDRDIANTYSIDFIHVGSEKRDAYEISSVADIEVFL